MKHRLLLITALFGLTFFANSQSISVEKSSYGIQSGILGIWVHNESHISNSIALRTELGMDVGFWAGTFYPKTGYLFSPVITLEPRWYYNLKKRHSKSKNIFGNSGNFLTIKSSFHPNWLVISNYDNVEIVNQISFIPTWGIKRNLGKHFTYETGIGIGYRYFFAKSAGYYKNEGEAALNLHLRIGYRL
ncbi:MAG: hypothetical protein J7J72_11040 [Bacteroidales bacterium]|nr:hypothetical protein [Bacteroidales bacterium]